MTAAEVDAGDIPGADEVRGAVERIVASDALRASPQLAAFLSFVVEAMLRGESKRIKAYTIAVEALGRAPSFDPEADSIVRVVAGRLRRALEHYYAGAGANEPIVVGLPRGSYVPIFQRRSAPQEPDVLQGEPEGPDAGAPRRRVAMPHRAVALAAIALIAVAAIGLLAFWTKDKGTAKEPASVSAPAPQSTGAIRPAPIVSVQPFEVIGKPTGSAFSIDRLRDELTDAMARFDGLNVVAEPPSSGGTAKPADWSEYRLTGRAEFDADGPMTLSFRLVDAGDGTVVWSREFSRLPAGGEPGAVEDPIVREVASNIAQPFGIIWTRELSAHSDRDPRRACLLETLEYWRRFDIGRHERVRECLGRMIADDPTYAPAYSGLAMVYLRDFYMDIAHAGEAPVLDRALEYAQRAVELRPQSARSNEALLVVRFARGEIAPAFAAGERALALNPYDTNAIADYGARLVAAGQIEKGIAMLNEAAAHTVVRPAWFDSYLFLGAWLAGDPAAARQHASLIASDVSPIGLVARIVAANLAGERDKVQQAVDRLVTINPSWRTEPRRLLGKFFPSTDIQDRLLRVLEAEGLGATNAGG